MEAAASPPPLPATAGFAFILVAASLSALGAPAKRRRRRLLDDVAKELLGTVLLVVLTFPPGKWVAASSRSLNWLLHGLGVVASDWLAGGPHANPSVSLAMAAIANGGFEGEDSTSAAVGAGGSGGSSGGTSMVCRLLARVATQLAGAFLGFGLLRSAGESAGLPALGGPTLKLSTAPAGAAAGSSGGPGAGGGDDGLQEALLGEALATFALCLAVFLLNFDLPVKRFYFVKQGLTAAFVRLLLLTFPASGPAMNPALGTGWAVVGTGSHAFPDFAEHYLCYWVASGLGALLAAAVYAAFLGQRFFGFELIPALVRRREQAQEVAKAAGERKEKGAKQS